MLRIYLYLALGVLPLSAQSSLNNGDKMNPDKAPEVLPPQPPANEVIRPGVNAPPPGTPPPAPELPAPPLVLPQIAQLTISPGTVREGLTDKDAVKATVILSAPATKDLLCHVVSAEPKKVICGDVVIPKGEQQEDLVVQINWLKVLHNCQVQIKAFDEENPETQLHARIYLRKKLE